MTNSCHQQTKAETESGNMQGNRYDVENLRFELLENGRRTGFVYYNGELLHEEGGIGQDLSGQTSYHLGIEIDALQRGQDLSYYHRDEQHSTVFVTSADGEIQNCYLYDAFGAELETTEQFQNRIRYTGQQYDDLTGQYYLRARYYNPVLGRFLQEDAYQGDGLNLYAYCGNNPVVYYDPSGYAETSLSGDGCLPNENIKEDDVPKNDDEPQTVTVYRGDRSSVTPDDVCNNGFSPKGEHNDPLLHTSSNATAENFVSTSGSMDIANDFAGKNGYVYVIETDNYIDINSTYGDLAIIQNK